MQQTRPYSLISYLVLLGTAGYLEELVDESLGVNVLFKLPSVVLLGETFPSNQEFHWELASWLQLHVHYLIDLQNSVKAVNETISVCLINRKNEELQKHLSKAFVTSCCNCSLCNGAHQKSAHVITVCYDVRTLH